MLLDLPSLVSARLAYLFSFLSRQGVAPFRGFVQERVALARRAIEKNGPNALDDWAPIYLFYGSRDASDFLYSDEWDGYASELQGKLKMHVALSRSGQRKADGSKVYVQDLLWDQRADISQAILEKRASVYVCGDGRHMSKDVEAKLASMLGEAKGGSKDVEGMAELKALKDRSRLLLDVWVRPCLFFVAEDASLTWALVLLPRVASLDSLAFACYPLEVSLSFLINLLCIASLLLLGLPSIIFSSRTLALSHRLETQFPRMDSRCLKVSVVRAKRQDQ